MKIPIIVYGHIFLFPALTICKSNLVGDLNSFISSFHCTRLLVSIDSNMYCSNHIRRARKTYIMPDTFISCILILGLLACPT